MAGRSAKQPPVAANPAPGPEPVRCSWAGIGDPLYARYHDCEWGVPQTDSRALFEKLTLERFQAGLSWLTILKKRENFRAAFDHFDAATIADYGATDIARLMADAGIVRNRAKVEATISNARAFLKLDGKIPFSEFIWSHVDFRPVINSRHGHGDVPAETPVSKTLSKNLKKHGFRFVGPTTMYAFMQSVGLVNDHLVACHRHSACASLQRDFQWQPASRTKRAAGRRPA